MRRIVSVLIIIACCIGMLPVSGAESASTNGENMPQGADNGLFGHIFLPDDEILPELEGVWHDPDMEWSLEFAGTRMRLYPDEKPDDPWIDEAVHAIRYNWGDPDGAVYIVPEDLTTSDFGGFSLLNYSDSAISGYMFVLDTEDSFCFRFERTDETAVFNNDPYVFDPLTDDPDLCYKPVIYLYPERETGVDVQIGPGVGLTCAYPAYGDGWHVTVEPDGTLTDASGMRYNYLFWEGVCDIDWDFSKGFCVPGSETAAFLETALDALGLSRREANEFIVYWLPQMRDNPCNLIAFQGENYTKAAQLAITPEPDTVNRVFMAWKALAEPVEIEPQALSAPERSGFTVVEWGGAQLK